jgi:hypothetical protein
MIPDAPSSDSRRPPWPPLPVRWNWRSRSTRRRRPYRQTPPRRVPTSASGSTSASPAGSSSSRPLVRRSPVTGLSVRVRCPSSIPPRRSDRGLRDYVRLAGSRRGGIPAHGSPRIDAAPGPRDRRYGGPRTEPRPGSSRRGARAGAQASTSPNGRDPLDPRHGSRDAARPGARCIPHGRLAGRTDPSTRGTRSRALP